MRIEQSDPKHSECLVVVEQDINKSLDEQYGPVVEYMYRAWDNTECTGEIREKLHILKLVRTYVFYVKD